MARKPAVKVAVVTGGARGLGEAVCRVFDEAGAEIVILDLRQDLSAKVASSLSNAMALPVDVSNEELVTVLGAIMIAEPLETLKHRISERFLLAQRLVAQTLDGLKENRLAFFDRGLERVQNQHPDHSGPEVIIQPVPHSEKIRHQRAQFVILLREIEMEVGQFDERHVVAEFPRLLIFCGGFIIFPSGNVDISQPLNRGIVGRFQLKKSPVNDSCLFVVLVVPVDFGHSQQSLGRPRLLRSALIILRQFFHAGYFESLETIVLSVPLQLGHNHLPGIVAFNKKTIAQPIDRVEESTLVFGRRKVDGITDQGVDDPVSDGTVGHAVPDTEQVRNERFQIA